MRICKAPGCSVRFEAKGMIVWCSPDHAIAIAQQRLAKKAEKAAKADRRETKAKLENLKTRSDYIKEAQREFNKYIRLRDQGKTCISCEVPLLHGSVGGGYDAGHFRSVGSAPHLRFDERNVHGQCKRCNRYGSGMAIDYRRGLLLRLDVDLVAAIEADQAPKHYTIEDLKEIKRTYKAKTKALAG